MSMAQYAEPVVQQALKASNLNEAFNLLAKLHDYKTQLTNLIPVGGMFSPPMQFGVGNNVLLMPMTSALRMEFINFIHTNIAITERSLRDLGVDPDA